MVSMMIVNTGPSSQYHFAVGVCDGGGEEGSLLNNSLQLVLMAVMAMMVVNTRASPFVLIDPATGRAVQQVCKNFKYTIWPKYANLGNTLVRTMQLENNFALCISNDYIEDTNMQRKCTTKIFLFFRDT